MFLVAQPETGVEHVLALRARLGRPLVRCLGGAVALSGQNARKGDRTLATGD
jgi:hypothetical protein